MIYGVIFFLALLGLVFLVKSIPKKKHETPANLALLYGIFVIFCILLGIGAYSGMYIGMQYDYPNLGKVTGFVISFPIAARLFYIGEIVSENNKLPKKKTGTLKTGEIAKITQHGRNLEIYDQTGENLLFTLEAEKEDRFEFFAEHETAGECPVLHLNYKHRSWVNWRYCLIDVSSQSMKVSGREERWEL